MSPTVATSPFFERQSQTQTAIDKVKKNEALTHPKLLGKKEEEPKILVVKSQGRHSSNNVARETSPKLSRKKSGKNISLCIENLKTKLWEGPGGGTVDYFEQLCAIS